MDKIDPATRQYWSRNPEQEVDLIIQYQGELAEISTRLNRQGVKVKRRFELTRNLSVRCSGRIALALLKEAWVVRVESDRPLKALGR